MGVARKILRMALILFGVIFLFSLIGAHLGHKGLVIVGEIDLPIWALYVICTLLFWVCSLFITALIIEEYTAKIFLYLLPFFIFDFILQIFYSNGLTSGLLPILYLLALGVRLKKIKLAFLIRALVVLGGIAFYTFGMRVIKTGKVTLDPNDVAPFQALISSIDLIILLVAAYAYGGVKYYAKKLEMVFPHGSEIDKMGGEDEIALAALKKLRGFSKTQVVLLLLCLNIFQWLAIILVCAIGDVLVEGIAITSSFILFGFIGVINRNYITTIDIKL